MNTEVAIKCGTGLIALGIGCYTVISVSAKGNGAAVESPYRNLILGRQINDGNDKLLSELRNFKTDVDKRMDEMAITLRKSVERNN
jgi:hypothetical protein